MLLLCGHNHEDFSFKNCVHVGDLMTLHGQVEVWLGICIASRCMGLFLSVNRFGLVWMGGLVFFSLPFIQILYLNSNAGIFQPVRRHAEEIAIARRHQCDRQSMHQAGGLDVHKEFCPVRGSVDRLVQSWLADHAQSSAFLLACLSTLVPQSRVERESPWVVDTELRDKTRKRNKIDC